MLLRCVTACLVRLTLYSLRFAFCTFLDILAVACDVMKSFAGGAAYHGRASGLDRRREQEACG